MPTVRLPRFQRSPDVAPMRLTPRDRQILNHLQRQRFLRSTHLASLLDASTQPVLRRLQLLYHHGYVNRPRCQIDYYHEGGSRPLVYCLGSRGVALLRREQDIPFARMEWIDKPSSVGRIFLDHALLVSDIMVRMELACRGRPEVELLDTDRLLADCRDVRRGRFCWTLQLDGRPCGVVPDRVFALEVGGQSRIHFCLEADRGTMPVARGSSDQSSILRKLRAYEAVWSGRLHQPFGWHRFRVVVVTTSEERMRAMQEACGRLTRGKGLFLFTTVAALSAGDDPLSLAWQTHQRDRTTTLLE